MKPKFYLPRLNAAAFRHKTSQVMMGGSWASSQPAEVQHNLRNFWLDGLFASASDAILGTYLVLYILSLGATEAQIGLMSALASLSATLLLLPGAMLVERLGFRKRISLSSGGIPSRLMIFCMVLAPFLLHGSGLVFLAIGLEITRQALGNFALPAWISLTGDLVPASWRGTYFASRNIVMSIASILVVIFTGEMITRTSQPEGYQLALGLSFALGITSAFFYSRLREPPLEPLPVAQRATISSEIFRPLLDNRPLLMLCLTAALWNFGLNIPGPFFSVYQVRYLMLTPAVIGLLSTVSSLAGLPAQRIMGPLADRLGPYRVQLIMGFLIPLLPLAWTFITRPEWSPWQITAVNLAGGFMWAGYSLASFNLLLMLTPAEQRARTSAIYQVIVSISLALGAATGGLIVSHWGYAAIFLTSAGIRWLAALLFARFVKAPEKESLSTPLSAPTSSLPGCIAAVEREESDALPPV